MTKKQSKEPDLMTFQQCAADGNVCPKTITRWVKKQLLAEWRPHEKSRTRRIPRSAWEAFKYRRK